MKQYPCSSITHPLTDRRAIPKQHGNPVISMCQEMGASTPEAGGGGPSKDFLGKAMLELNLILKISEIKIYLHT